MEGDGLKARSGASEALPYSNLVGARGGDGNDKRSRTSIEIDGKSRTS